MAAHHDRRIARIRAANDGKLPPLAGQQKRQPVRQRGALFATSGDFNRPGVNARRRFGLASKRRNRA